MRRHRANDVWGRSRKTNCFLQFFSATLLDPPTTRVTCGGRWSRAHPDVRANEEPRGLSATCTVVVLCCFPEPNIAVPSRGRHPGPRAPRCLRSTLEISIGAGKRKSIHPGHPRLPMRPRGSSAVGTLPWPPPFPPFRFARISYVTAASTSPPPPSKPIALATRACRGLTPRRRSTTPVAASDTTPISSNIRNSIPF